MDQTTIDRNGKKARLLAFTALVASLLISIQLALIAWQGEAACFNEGCRIVERLTRVSPFVFNLFGLLFFLFIGLLAVSVRNRPIVARFFSLLLLAAMAGEGVLLAYQYHVARAWCSYCLVIFGLVAFCNLIVGLRQLFSAAVLVAAVNIIFALLRFEPAPQAAQGQRYYGGHRGRSSRYWCRQEHFPHLFQGLPALPDPAAETAGVSRLHHPPQSGR